MIVTTVVAVVTMVTVDSAGSGDNGGMTTWWLRSMGNGCGVVTAIAVMAVASGDSVTVRTAARKTLKVSCDATSDNLSCMLQPFSDCMD